MGESEAFRSIPADSVPSEASPDAYAPDLQPKYPREAPNHHSSSRSSSTAVTRLSGTVPSGDPEQRHAVIISIPLIGHLRPLLVQGQELLRRGWSVEIITTHSLAGYMAASGQRGFAFRDVGDCSSSSDGRDGSDGGDGDGVGSDLEGAGKRDVFRKACNTTASIEAALEIVNWCSRTFPCLWRGILDSVRERKPDLVLSDMFTNIAREDIRHAMLEVQASIPEGGETDDDDGLGYEIPFRAPPHVVNVPFPLYTIGNHLLPPADYLPPAFSGRGQLDMGNSLLERAFLPPLRLFLRWSLGHTLDVPLNRERASVGVPPLDSFTKLDDCLLIVNTVFPLEYPRPVS